VASNSLLGLGYNTFTKHLGLDSRCVYKDNVFLSCIGAQKNSTYNIHTYSHPL